MVMKITKSIKTFTLNEIRELSGLKLDQGESMDVIGFKFDKDHKLMHFILKDITAEDKYEEYVYSPSEMKQMFNLADYKLEGVSLKSMEVTSEVEVKGVFGNTVTKLESTYEDVLGLEISKAGSFITMGEVEE